MVMMVMAGTAVRVMINQTFISNSGRIKIVR